MAENRLRQSFVWVLAAEERGPMDCCDDDPRKVWVVADGWSYHRAILTHAAPFLEAAGTDDLHALPNRLFTARLDLSAPPPFVDEGPEHLEWPDLTVCDDTPLEEIYEEIGFEPGLERLKAQKGDGIPWTYMEWHRSVWKLSQWLQYDIGDAEEARLVALVDGKRYRITGVRQVEAANEVQLRLTPID